jgi:hypothetical protein
MAPTPEAGEHGPGSRDPGAAQPPDTASQPPGPRSGRPSLHETAELALQRVHERVGRPGLPARRREAGPLFDGSEPGSEPRSDPEPRPDPGARADLDPRPGPGPLPGSVSPPGGDDRPERARVVIRNLAIRRSGIRVHVAATLALGGRSGCGTVEALNTSPGLWRGVGEATLAALDELAGSGLRVAIDRITVASGEEPPSVRVLLTAQLDAGEETLLGATLLHEDPASAVMRATLDALNGRIEPLLRAAGGGALAG